ncbi:tRNA adenosine deaminase-associated protein [Nocardioides yefusunii]|uniref:tRNA adenosine deaminase-associated protein n=1 Tax=Nocardioides yefusunii TaxID=2500546 RepID=A0ABW1R4A8_9ACTN|nr:tRNA adenosine deaminase-associated protein [Nocardioides yefusunii]
MTELDPRPDVPDLDESEPVDLAFAAFRVGGQWQVDDLDDDDVESVATLGAALREFDGDAGALALVTVDDDFFVLVRVDGSRTRVLLSDVTASTEWDLAASVLDHLALPDPDEDDDGPAGDLGIVADLGMHPVDMGVLLDDVELYPDEMLSTIATRLGFGREFDEAAGLDSL